jgi:hypothetical protein
MKLPLVAALLLGCSRTATPAAYIDSGEPLTAPSTPCTDSECDTIMKTQTVNATRGKLACCYLLLGSVQGCQWPINPPPQPAATGGSVSTGGSSATGGKAAMGGASATGGMKATGGEVATGGTSAAPTTDPYVAACANELALGCPEGAKLTCATDMAYRCGKSKKAKCKTDCVVNATTKSELQTKCFVACGSN